jgi:hypothetical protein
MSLDHVLIGFLQTQYDRGLALAAQSDLFELIPLPSRSGPPSRYLANFHCRGLIREADGAIGECNFFSFGIWFSPEHLRKPDPLVVTVLEPTNVFHPNIRGPFVCLGHISPGISLVDLLYQIFEIVVYRNWAPHDGLNGDACQWARHHADRFPTDPRPLKRRAVSMTVTSSGANKS